MSSKRDLVEAHSFNRRRLVTAFLSGAPGGREVEPVRYGRTLVGGAVLALLIVAGAAVSGYIKPSVPEDWSDGGLVVGEDSGSRFVALEGTLYPVINTTSARLVLSGDGEMTVNFVPEDMIAEAPQGSTIGIQGAPDALPAPGSMVESGWTACTDGSGGIAVSLEEQPVSTPVPDEAVRVTTKDGAWVVTGNRRYQLPQDATTRAALLRALAIDDQPERGVTGVWLDLVPPGSSLEPFTVPGAGDRVDTGVPGLDTVGTPLSIDGRPYVLGAGGTLVSLTPFASAVYTSSGPGARLAERAIEVTAAEVATLRPEDDDAVAPYPEDWPVDEVEDYATPNVSCLLLDTEEDAVATVSLAAPSASAPDVPSGQFSRTVAPGGGALVRATTGGVLGVGRVFLVDSTGTRYAVGTQDDAASALTSLGYGTVVPRPVPQPWTLLFRDGPALTREGAGQSAGASAEAAS
jgi:type VII secretion protein EccB